MQIVGASKTCAVDNGTVAEVSGSERLQLLRKLDGGDIVAIGCSSGLPTDHAGAARLAIAIGSAWCGIHDAPAV